MNVSDVDRVRFVIGIEVPLGVTHCESCKCDLISSAAAIQLPTGWTVWLCADCGLALVESVKGRGGTAGSG